MGFFDGKPVVDAQPEIKPVSTEAVTEPIKTEPVVIPVKAVNYKVLNTLIEQKFLYVQSGMIISENGELTEKVTFVMANQSGRNTPSRTIPILYCPVTGASLTNVDFSQLTIK